MVQYATVAQLVERLTCNEDVAGSTPAGGSTELLIEKKFSGRCPSGQREQTVNLPAYAFEGSNPSLPTRGHQELVTGGDKSLGSSVVERFLGKEKVGSSTLLSGSRH